ANGMKTAQRSGIAFGTKVSLKAQHAEAAVLETALDAAWREIVRVEQAVSLFRSESAISRLNRDGVLDDPPETLVQMLAQALDIARLTDGAFDPTVQPLWKVYDAAFAAGRPATDSDVAAAGALIGFSGVEVGLKRIRLGRPGMALTLNGVAQGFATGRCLAVLGDHGIANAFLDTGEIGAVGTHDDHSPWTAAIADPRQPGTFVALARPLAGVLATSGDYATVWSDDFSHHHILDPKTRHSPPVTASVSVLAHSGGLADGLATAMMVMGPQKSIALAARLPGVEALIVTKSGERFQTPGFPFV
ncbi:MAG: FAD:protein FMN transferase, partial [Hyphomicrobium sp.]